MVKRNQEDKGQKGHTTDISSQRLEAKGSEADYGR
jgi:hypothetical protein